MKRITDVDVIFDKVKVGGDDTEDVVSASNTLGISTEDENDEQISIQMRSRRYNILNIADLEKAPDNMPKDIELQIENSPFRHSGLRINKVNKYASTTTNTIQTEQVNIRNYQNGFQRKKRVSTFKMKMNYVSITALYVNCMKSSRKTIHNI